jgi:hypothetical protein
MVGEFWCGMVGWLVSFGLEWWDGWRVFVWNGGMVSEFWCGMVGWLVRFGVEWWDGW